jgi:lipopolysaccharide biosynthesis glycosyltransferase
MTLRVYIGYDGREAEAYRVAESSLRKHASVPVDVTPLNAETLAAYGLLRRPQDRRGYTYDIHSNAPQATDFAISRFLVPHLAQQGWALFVDCDVVFLADVAELFEHVDHDKAVMVVKHQQPEVHGTKMDGQAQLHYPRKNWSSVCLFNASHPANKRLTIQDVNERPGRDLHKFYWLHDSEIGSLPDRFNWLVDVAHRPHDVVIAHMTLGGPWISNWAGGSFDEEWFRAANG